MCIVRARWRTPVEVSLSNGAYTLYSVPPPGSGLLLGFIINILDEYNLSPESIRGDNAKETYQRLIEVFKYAYARRTLLGDEDFEDMTKVREARNSHLCYKLLTLLLYLNVLMKLKYNDLKSFPEINIGTVSLTPTCLSLSRLTACLSHT